MAIERGWLINLTISPDGGANWYEFDEMTTVNPSSEPETEEIRTINKNGLKETKIVASSRSYEVSGYWSKRNYSTEIIKKSHSTNDEFHIRFYPDKTDLYSYIESRCIASSLSEEDGAEGFATYSATLEVQGNPRFIGNTV
jgi:hypothetical protein